MYLKIIKIKIMSILINILLNDHEIHISYDYCFTIIVYMYLHSTIVNWNNGNASS